ncbi:hypothetical protein [Mycobacteroides abscessus]|uniref:hypothetical protein n=1 Tax=Mycobacteroides abscessus TaxID=36809 RepID=UPI0009A5D99D|nr:hypothetical protein [Mycobacteroides abscessus]SLH06734.1 Uncharacterised protein [Mycobacteroides abscessus subsp. abscessus]
MSAAGGRTLPPFPINDATLAQLQHALRTSVAVDDEGNRSCVGGDFTLPQLLDFYSGADESRSTLVGYAGDTPIYECWDQRYSEHDVMLALIQRVRELESARHR